MKNIIESDVLETVERQGYKDYLFFILGWKQLTILFSRDAINSILVNLNDLWEGEHF